MVKKIQTNLLQWFKKNKRDLPWRKTKDPYAIWVSEVMLQQTQVATVIPYYQNFLKIFPTVHDLAKANLSKVLKVWEGLGYYSRARNLHQASQMITNHFNGKIPDNFKDLITLPGVGRYTAGAILSIAFNQTAPILDGNVKRVLSRLYAISGASQKTKNLLWTYSASLIPEGRARSFNQALMDLGAMLCTPKNPLCVRCPLKQLCKGYQSGEPERFPTRITLKRIPQIEAVSAVIRREGKVLLTQRPPKGLLGGLWEFPNWRMGKNQRSRMRSRLRNTLKKEMGMDVEVKEHTGVFHQTYSHFKLALHVFQCQLIEGRGKATWASVTRLNRFPMSRIHRRIANTITRTR